MASLIAPLAIGIWTVTLSLGGVVAVILAIAAIVSLLGNADLSGGAKVMWVLIIILFPILGAVVYFTVRSSW
jgi:hypothetical protein